MKSKILFILHLPPPVHGASMISKWIKNSSIINSSFHSDYINLATSFNLEDIGKYSLVKLTALLKIQKNIISAVSKTDYDVCYMTLTSKGPGFYKDLFVVLLLKLFRKKIVLHFHNKGVRANSNTWYKKLCYQIVFNNVKCILISPLLYNDISDYVKNEDVYYCTNGIPEIDSISKKELKTDICSFLFLSNMMENKGVFTLLEACQILTNKNLKYECNFVGDWSDIDEDKFLSKVASLGISNHVFAHGKKYNADKTPYLEQANVFVHPTHEDIFALVLLEAMQYNLAIIASEEGAIPEIVIDGESGYIIEKKNAEELAKKMELFIKNPELSIKMGSHGNTRYNKFFTFQQLEKRMTSILEEISTTES